MCVSCFFFRFVFSFFRLAFVFINTHFYGHLCNFIECGNINPKASSHLSDWALGLRWGLDCESFFWGDPGLGACVSSGAGRPNKFCVWLNKHVVELSPTALLLSLWRRRACLVARTCCCCCWAFKHLKTLFNCLK